MNDTSKCSGNNCPMKKKCKRYTAKSAVWQAYIQPPVKDGKCDYFTPNIQTT